MGSPRAVVMSPNPGTNAGGVERFCFQIGAILRNEGYEVVEVGPTGNPGTWTFRLGAMPLHWSVTTGRAVRAARPDLIIGNGFLGLTAPREVPRIQVFHGTSLGETLASRKSTTPQDYLRRIASYTAVESVTCRAGTLAVVSESAAEETRRLYRHGADAVITNGVDLRIFAPSDRAAAREQLGLDAKARTALFVGRPEYRKGADVIGRAAAGAGWTLAVAGSSSVEGATHLGVLAPPQLAVAYAAADCLLFPTRYEACSYVILEAMACGLPVVTTRVGWTRTLLRDVPAYEGLIVDVGATAAITRRLLEWDAAEAQHCASLARDYVVANNSLSRFEDDWRTFIRSVVGR